VVIAATNVVRFRVNAGMRAGLGVSGDPQRGETLLVLRNNYDLDVYNGEQITFDGWSHAPDEAVQVRDRYTGAEAAVRFGEAVIGDQRAVIAVEELHGELPEIGGLTLSIAAEAWARTRNLWAGERPTPFLQANFGYCYTAHKSQGSEWPYALVMLEPNVKMNSEDGRRWAYTAVTRAKNMAAVFYGRV
jgi:hypothetical protein